MTCLPRREKSVVESSGIITDLLKVTGEEGGGRR
jgi:hypothetical protein